MTGHEKALSFRSGGIRLFFPCFAFDRKEPVAASPASFVFLIESVSVSSAFHPSDVLISFTALLLKSFNSPSLGNKTNNARTSIQTPSLLRSRIPIIMRTIVAGEFINRVVKKRIEQCFVSVCVGARFSQADRASYFTRNRISLFVGFPRRIAVEHGKHSFFSRFLPRVSVRFYRAPPSRGHSSGNKRFTVES